MDRLHDIVIRIPGMTTDLLNNTIHPNIAFDFEVPSPGIIVPASAEQFFDAAYHLRSLNAPTGRPSLTDLTDAFLANFYESTYRFQPGPELMLHRQPPNDQYVNLLKCIWLMGKIRSSEELENSVTDSHWPSYVKELEKQLSEQCARFSKQTWQGLAQPDPLDITETNTKMWSEANAVAVVHIRREENLEEILRTNVTRARYDNDLVGLSIWRAVQLDQWTNGAADEFRLRFSFNNGLSSESGYPSELDFSLERAIIQPIFAVGQDARFGGSFIIETGPTTMARTSTKLDFPSSKEMLKFQHALTGYKVWGSKMFHASVKFVYGSGPRGNNIPTQEVCLQLWTPKRMEALASRPSSPSDSGISMTLARRVSTLSPTRPGPPSIAATMRTTYTAGSTRTMPVQVEGNASGILHVRPNKPLLVLFTKDPTRGDSMMITLELDALNVNPTRCHCHRNDQRSQQCLNVAIERDGGREGEPMSGVTRYEVVGENQRDWDISRLAFKQRGRADKGRRTWADLTRLTLEFRDVNERKKFSGENCGCKNRGRTETETWAALQDCVGQNHRGLLGEVKMHYRRQVWEYGEGQNHRRHVIRNRRE